MHQKENKSDGDREGTGRSLMLYNLQINFTYYFIGQLPESEGLILFEMVENWGSQRWSDWFTQGHSSSK